MYKRKFIIDTDTASDDAVALLMALEWPDVEVEAVTIVSRNMPVEQGTINPRYTIELCKKTMVPGHILLMILHTTLIKFQENMII